MWIKGDPDCTEVICVLLSNLTEHTCSFGQNEANKLQTKLQTKPSVDGASRQMPYWCEIKAVPFIINNLFLPSRPEAGSGMSQESIYRYKDPYWLNSCCRHGYMVVGQMCWGKMQSPRHEVCRFAASCVSLCLHTMPDWKMYAFSKEKKINVQCMIVFQHPFKRQV